MIKRLFDIFFSSIGLILLLVLFLLIAILLKLESKGPIFYKQIRVGRNCIDFKIFKFRTMFVGSDKKGLLTIGDKDPRVTKTGYFLRKYKLDELPQLLNVFLGSMSFVGPRPEIRKYVDLYSKSDLEILTIKPGITDYASIIFRNEAEMLKGTNNAEELYINEIMPKKIALNKSYIGHNNILVDFKIIFKTFKTIVS